MIFNMPGYLPDAVTKDMVVNNFTTTEEGFVADARALKLLNDSKLSMELLWENASFYSSFSAQTITITGLSKYKLIAIEHKGGVAWAINQISMTISSVNVYENDNAVYKYTRRLDLSGDKIIIQDAYNIATNNYRMADNNLFVPFRIYGVKGVSA